MASLRVTVLGEMRLELDDAVVSLPAKAGALFVYLASTRRRHGREALLELLWSVRSPQDEGANLRMALLRLRRELGEYLTIEREAVSLRPEASPTIDALEFERLVRQRPQGLASLARAAELYRGDFMDGWYLPDAPRFEEWLAAERERLRQLARDCFAALAEQYAARNDLSAAIEHANRLLRLEPWQESSHRRLMRLYARRGDFESALRQFETCRELLERDLGVGPTAATRQLRERIEAARDRPPPDLPPDYTPFLGREEELSTVLAQLGRPECRLLNVTGPGGVGKTRLALEAARRLQGAYLEGIHFVSLVAAQDRDSFLEALLGAVGAERTGNEEPLALLVRALRPREALLVLDNFEQLGGSCGALLAELLDSAPSLTLLVTSRSRLDLRREWVVPLGGLSCVPAGGNGTRRVSPADDLTGESVDGRGQAISDAELLFLAAAERAGAGAEWGPEEHEDVALICRLVEGHPLAIELAAATRWRLSTARIVRQLREGIDALQSTSADLPERSRSLRAVFAHSLRLLTTEECGLLERVSVFVGGFTLEAAERVCGGDPALLDSLVGKSLLRRTNSDRYDFHPLIREFARERLAGRPLARELARRHASYYLEHTRESLRHFWSADLPSWLTRSRVEQENLREALRWLHGNDPAQGLALARRLWQFWMQWGQLGEGRRWLTAMLEAAPGGEPTEEHAEALNGAASLAFLQGDYPAARSHYEGSLAHFERLGDEQGAANVLNNLANVVRSEGDLGRAGELYRRSLVIRERLGDRRGVASSLSNLGLVAERQGDLDGALCLYDESLAIRREVEDVKGIAISLCNLGFATAKRGDYGSARDHLLACLRLASELGSRSLIADCLRGLGGVEGALCRGERAALLWGAAAALREETGGALEPAEQADLDCNVAKVRLLMNDAEFEAAWAQGRRAALDEPLQELLALA